LNDLQKPAAAQPKRYHHGNLRDTLIIAAAQLIEENASVDFAMIDAARRAGVSSAAPYRHFKDKDALLEAVSQLAFLGLTEAVQHVAKGLPKGSEQVITVTGKAYIGYVTEHRAFYDLMWGDMGLRAFEAADIEIKTSGFYVLVDAVHNWCDASSLSEYNAQELAVKLWAMAHGLACLAMNQQLEKFLPEVDVYSLLESSTRTFLEGLRRLPAE
jgi:AcrR family transcriptional regulator